MFLPTSETAIYGKAFERVRHDPQVECLMILIDSQMKRLIGENMKAYGENSGSRWARNRQIAYLLRRIWLIFSSIHRLDPQNVDHLFMRFYVEGEISKATVRLEMTRVHSQESELLLILGRA